MKKTSLYKFLIEENLYYRFIVNLKRDNKYPTIEEFSENHGEDRNALSSAFYWTRSKQGGMFWRNAELKYYKFLENEKVAI